MDNQVPPSGSEPLPEPSLPPSPATAPPPLPGPPAPSRAGPRPAPVVAARAPVKNRGWKIATVVLALLLALSVVTQVAGLLIGQLGGIGNNVAESRLQELTLEHNHSDNKIAVIPVEGIITGSASEGMGYGMTRLIEEELKMAGRDESVKAVLLKVNSPGGEVLASDDIYNAIAQFQTDHQKPVIASMGSLAASGGYYVSAPCRWIVANELTITGSIGVIMHGYNYRSLMNKVGVRPMVYKSGRFKDMLSGEKDLDTLTPAEKADVEEENAMVSRMIDETFQKFKEIVGAGRDAAHKRNQANNGGATGRPLTDQWAKLADGRVLSGKEAYANGFVDELGNWRTAVKRAQQLAGIDNADLVTYQVPFSLSNLLGLFGKSDAKSLRIDLGPEFPKLGAGLYYLAPAFLR